MAELAQVRGEQQIWITRTHLIALTLTTLLIAVLAFFVGLRVGQGQVEPPTIAAAPVLLPDPKQEDALEELLQQIEATQAPPAELSFPDALSDKGQPASPTQPLPSVALPATIPATPGLSPPTPAALPALPPKQGWAVQVSSFEAAVDADAQVKELVDSGWPAYRVTALVKGRNWHRVRVGGYPSRQAASEASAELATNLGRDELMIARAP